MLAGVSVDYYTRMERGNLAGVSDSVLAGLARALQLDEAERDHLYDLARAANPAPKAGRRASQRVRPRVQQTLDAMAGVPAYVRNGRRDLLAANRLGYALYSEMYADPARPANVARFIFLSPRARTFFLDWDRAASDMVAALRTEAGRNPYDRGLSDLVGELCTRSEEFSVRWASHNVRFHRSGLKDVHHPAVGDLHLSFEAMELPGRPRTLADRLQRRTRLRHARTGSSCSPAGRPRSTSDLPARTAATKPSGTTRRSDRAQPTEATQHPWSRPRPSAATSGSTSSRPVSGRPGSGSTWSGSPPGRTPPGTGHANGQTLHVTDGHRAGPVPRRRTRRDARRRHRLHPTR